MRAIIIIAVILTTATASNPTLDTNQDSEKDDDTSRKIIGSRYVYLIRSLLNQKEHKKITRETGVHVYVFG